MKVLAILPALRDPSRVQGPIGGGEISNRLLLQGLAGLGHQVTIVCRQGERVFAQDRGDVVARVLSPGARCGPVCRLSFGHFAVSTAVSMSPDVILTATDALPAGLLAGRRAASPVGLIVRGYEHFDSGLSIGRWFRKGVKSILQGSYGRKAVARADFLLACSEYLGREYAAVAPAVPVHVVYPPVESVDGRPAHRPEGVRRVAMVGVREGKGLDVFESLARRFPSLEFLSFGHADLPPGACEREGNRVRLGWSRVSDVLRDDVDVLLVPSSAPESFGRAAVEGLLGGCVVLASDMAGLPEALAHEPDLLVAAGDLEAWEGRLRRVVDAPDRFLAATRRALSNARQFRSTEQVRRLERAIMKEVRYVSR